MKYNSLALMIVLAGSVAARALAEEPSLAEQAKAALAKHQLLSYALPGQPPFQTADGQQKLELTDAQKATIRDIGSIFNGKLRDQREAMLATERQALDLAGDAKQKFLNAFWAKEAERAAERRQWAIAARRQVEQLLTEKQLQMLRDMEFAQRTQYLVNQPHYFVELKLDEVQQAKMNQLRDDVEKRRQELTAKILQDQTDASRQMLNLLTPEQRERLRAALEKAYEDALQIR